MIHIFTANRNVDYDDFFEETGWQHICVTWENGAGNWKLYVNGESVKSGSGLQPGVVVYIIFF